MLPSFLAFKFFLAQRVMLSKNRYLGSEMTISVCKLDTECLSKVDEKDIPQHDHHRDQAECDIEPIQADTINPRLKGKYK